MILGKLKTNHSIFPLLGILPIRTVIRNSS